MKAAEKRYLSRVAECSCSACWAPGPSECHHPRFAAGMGQRAHNHLVIALCYECHRGALSIHLNKRQFEAIYGEEPMLLAKTIEQVFKGCSLRH